MAKKKSKYFYRLEDLPLIPLLGETKARMVAGKHMLVSFLEHPPGFVYPLHSHPAEQIQILLEGEEEHICGDEKFLMKAGDICVHPPNVEHGATTKTAVKGIDIFSPPREDYLEKLKNALKERGEK